MDHPTTTSQLGLRLTPHGRLVAEPGEDAPSIDDRTAARLAEAFAQGSGYGLVRLAAEIGQTLPPAFIWWRGFASRYIASLCLQSTSAKALPHIPPPAEAELASLVLTAPIMAGAEYLTQDILRALWAATGSLCHVPSEREVRSP